MSEDALIRLDNLKAVCEQRRLKPGDLAKLLKGQPSYFSDLLRGKKSFGEKTARKLEEALQLPRGWLDQSHPSHDETHIGVYTTPIGGSSASPLGERDAVYDVNAQASPLPSTPIFMLSDTKTARAPVVEWARLGVDLLRANNDWPAAVTVPFIAKKQIGPRCKALVVPDNSLAPRIISGDIVVIDPDDTRPKRDKIALFLAPDGTYMLRWYRPLADEGFEAYDAAGVTLDWQRHGLVVVGTHVCTIPNDD